MLSKSFFVISIVAINVVTFEIAKAFVSKSYPRPLRPTQNTSFNAISNVVIGETNIQVVIHLLTPCLCTGIIFCVSYHMYA